MNKQLITIAIVALIASFVGGITAGLVGGNQSDQRLGGTRFPNGISADSTSPSAGEVRGTTLTSTGAATLASSNVTGALDVDGETTVDGFTQGAGCTVLTDANGGTYTLTEAELLAANCFEFAAGGAGQATIALTLPATTTMTTLLSEEGGFREWVYDSSALAAATTTTVTAGTGIDLIGVTTNDDVIDGGEYARLSCWRKTNTDVACITSELLNVD